MSFHAYPLQAEEYNSLIRNPFGARQKQVKFIEAPSPPPPQNLNIPFTLKKEKKWKAPLKLKKFPALPIVCIGVSTPSKTLSPSFSPRPLLKPSNCPSPAFY